MSRYLHPLLIQDKIDFLLEISHPKACLSSLIVQAGSVYVAIEKPTGLFLPQVYKTGRKMTVQSRWKTRTTGWIHLGSQKE
jgi:NADH:ubiquinone oxidoreductase subunit D